MLHRKVLERLVLGVKLRQRNEPFDPMNDQPLTFIHIRKDNLNPIDHQHVIVSTLADIESKALDIEDGGVGFLKIKPAQFAGRDVPGEQGGVVKKIPGEVDQILIGRGEDGPIIAAAVVEEAEKLELEEGGHDGVAPGLENPGGVAEAGGGLELGALEELGPGVEARGDGEREGEIEVEEAVEGVDDEEAVVEEGERGDGDVVDGDLMGLDGGDDEVFGGGERGDRGGEGEREEGRGGEGHRGEVEEEPGQGGLPGGGEGRVGRGEDRQRGHAAAGGEGGPWPYEFQGQGHRHVPRVGQSLHRVGQRRRRSHRRRRGLRGGGKQEEEEWRE